MLLVSVVKNAHENEGPICFIIKFKFNSTRNIPHKLIYTMCKTVQFSVVESITIATLKPTYDISKEANSTLWYQRSELETFRTNAKTICKSAIRKRKLSSMSQVSEGVCMRGLELATDSERKKRKRYANKIVVSAQKSMKADELAAISSNMSQWSRENAIKDARFDFLAACPIYLS